MPSSTSSSDPPPDTATLDELVTRAPEPHARETEPIAPVSRRPTPAEIEALLREPALREPIHPHRRETAADRPGVVQPVPVRDIPAKPWRRIFAGALVLALVLTVAWEWRMRALELAPGDLGDGPSVWAEQRRRIDHEPVPVAIVGDSRILFDTDLDRFEALTGVRPVQLALPGTNARPFLEDLAADPDFRGLLIVGIAEVSYFRPGVGMMKDALPRYHFESPAQRSSYLIHRELRRHTALLDPEYRLSRLVERLDPNWRSGVEGPYDGVWKIIRMGDQRHAWLWPRIEHDARLRAHARSAWHDFKGPVVSDALIRTTQRQTREAVAGIRARGGDVIFVRPPDAAQLRVNEDKRLPRARGWDPLLAAAGVQGVHADDLPGARGLVIPEYSHLTRACATVFTDIYVRRLAALTPRIRLKPNAPPPLSARDCR
jgi:hypothetical protein